MTTPTPASVGHHGATKRPATYVPVEARRKLDHLSKADLMELLWDVAAINTGEADSATPEEILAVIRSSHDALKFNGWQGAAKLP